MDRVEHLEAILRRHPAQRSTEWSGCAAPVGELGVAAGTAAFTVLASTQTRTLCEHTSELPEGKEASMRTADSFASGEHGEQEEQLTSIEQSIVDDLIDGLIDGLGGALAELAELEDFSSIAAEYAGDYLGFLEAEQRI
jgi:hypothetical protein